MNEATNAFAKLAGILKSAKALLKLQWEPGTARATLYDQFDPVDAKACFEGAAKQLEILRRQLPSLYDDFPLIDVVPKVPMGATLIDQRIFYARTQVEALIRAIEQMFEIRSNSELAAPTMRPIEPCVFLTHGSAQDWREVQAFIERDVRYKTLELAQQPNQGRSILVKLDQESSRCNSAVIVMTGDDSDADGNARARENVMHEIGYFQGKFGLSRVCLLHEEGTNIPSNIHGLVYIPFTKGNISMTFGPLLRELNGLYRV
jgi:predicted nucleotide-binding protein